MRKYRILTLIFGLMLSVSVYSQTSILEHLLFQGTFYKDFFPNGGLSFSSYIRTEDLNIMQLGAAWEQPLWKGLGYLGIEAGYSSGSKFGGGSSMDFVPVLVNAGYDFLLGDFFSAGPNIKLGGFGLFTPIGSKFVPMIAGHVEGEFRYKPFPLSLYAAGGVDFFPTVSGILPALELGIRFRPFALFNRSNSNEKSVAAGGQSGTAALNQDAAAASSSSAQAPVVSAQGSGSPSSSSAQAPVVSTQGSGAPSVSLLPNRGSQTQSAGIPPEGVPVVIEGRQGRLRSVYFEPDTDVLLEASRSALDVVGREMSANSALQLILQAYTTSAKTPEGRLMVSRERANFCQNYLTRSYGIASNRITSYHYGSERMPLMATDNMESQRCVELIIIE
jgi:outer membrane protein OmpA-like peptidoglycan-associated protein